MAPISAEFGKRSSRNPQRAYVTGMTVALGGILMFFMALISAWVVRKGRVHRRAAVRHAARCRLNTAC